MLAFKQLDSPVQTVTFGSSIAFPIMHSFWLGWLDKTFTKPKTTTMDVAEKL
jgi:hypothetical protein